MKTNNIIHWTIKIGWEDGTEEYIAEIPDWVAKPVDEFLGEIEKEKREEEPEPVLATRHSDNEVIDVTLTEDIAFEEGFKQGKLAQKKGDELPADRDDRLYHEEQDTMAMEKAKVDQKVHNHPLGTGFAHKDKKETK